MVHPARNQAVGEERVRIELPTDQLARDIARYLTTNLEPQPQPAVDPLEFLDMRDLVGELKMSLSTIKVRIAEGNIEDADAHNGVRRVWTRRLVNEIKLGMMVRETPGRDR